MKVFMKKFFKYLLFLRFIVIFNMITLSLISSNECDYENPFFTEDEQDCVTAEKCPPENINSGICQITNEIVKIQWFNNIIYFSDLYNFSDYN